VSIRKKYKQKMRDALFKIKTESFGSRFTEKAECIFPICQ
jgi:hypothetical protein